MKAINLQKALGMENEFAPNYQFESEEFAPKVNYYMDRFFDSENQPERYMSAMRCAIKWANKSIMLDKLGLSQEQDLERSQPELFKSTFLQLANEDPSLLVKGESVFQTPDLMKSLGADETPNQHYEKIWMRTYDTLVEV